VIQVSLSGHLLPILVGNFCRQDQSESQVLGQNTLTLSPAINFLPVQVSHLIRRFGILWESHSRTNCEPPETNSHSSLQEDPSKMPSTAKHSSERSFPTTHQNHSSSSSSSSSRFSVGGSSSNSSAGAQVNNSFSSPQNNDYALRRYLGQMRCEEPWSPVVKR
jgi:hypothetical protein